MSELLTQVGLPADRASAYPHELSGGQRQRVMIAMALACNPRLIIADEPTTALDVMVQAQILRLIEQLVRDHDISLMIISHDLAVLADTCDRLAVMYAGRVVEEGPARQVFESASHPYSAALSEAFPRIGDPTSRLQPRGLAGDPPDPADLPSGCSFHPRCPSALDACPQVDPELWPTVRLACRLRAGAARPGCGPGGGGGPVTGEGLQAEGVLVEFAGRGGRDPARAVDGVDLQVRPGEIVALVGESGCGKTTLARTLLGLERPTEGTVSYDGRPSSTRARRCRRSAVRSSSSCRTPAARSIRGTRSTTPSPRACGSTAASPTSRPRSPRPCPGPACGHRSGSSCATRTSCPAASASGW